MYSDYTLEAFTTNQRWYKTIVGYKVWSDGKIFGSRSGSRHMVIWSYGPRAVRAIAKYIPVWHSQSITSIFYIQTSGLDVI